MIFPFEASLDDIQKQSDDYVAAIFSVLESEFLILPRGEGFVDYTAFEVGYEALKHATANFTTMTPAAVLAASGQVPIVNSRPTMRIGGTAKPATMMSGQSAPQMP